MRSSRGIYGVIALVVLLVVSGCASGASTGTQPRTAPQSAASPVASVSPRPSASPSPTAVIQGPTFILLRASTITPDARINFMGQGFLPGEQASVTIEDTQGNTEVELDPVSVAQDGQIYEASATVSAGLAPGGHTLRVVGQTSGRTATAALQVRWLRPMIQLESFSAKAKHTFGFSGGGFTPGEAVDMFLGGLGGSPLATFMADGDGVLAENQAPIPLLEPGDYPLYFVGRESRTPVSLTFNVQGFQPWVVLDNYSPPPYYLMGFSGNDFVPGETVLVYLNNRSGAPITRVAADLNGQFAIKNAFEIPELAGESTVIFVGQQGNSEVSARFRPMAFGPALELTSYAGRVGSHVAFTGSGWARNERLNVYSGDEATGRQKIGTFQADASGVFQAAGAVRVPVRTPAGGLPLTVLGEVSNASVTLWYQVLELNATAELSAYQGPPGTVVSFTGRSFAGSERVSVHLGDRGGPVLAQAVTDEDGRFELVGSYPVSGEWGQAVPFVLVGEESSATATTHFKIANPSGP